MKVLLIQPPIQDFYSTPQRIYPLGLLYLGTVLKTHGFEVKILDACRGKKFSISLPQEFSFLKEFYKANFSPFKLFDKYYHFGLEFLNVKEEIKNFSPRLIGVSANFIPYIEEALKICELAKCINRDMFVVVGGNAVSVFPEVFLQSDFIDFLIRGEAEFSFLKLCLLVKENDLNLEELSKIEGIGFKTPQKFFLASQEAVIKDLSTLPIPDRNLLNSDFYKIGNKRFTQILTTRGCPKKCDFCSLPNRKTRIFRKRNLENVLGEIEVCVKEFNIKFFDIEDDNFCIDKEYALKFLNSVKEEFEDIELSFMNGLDTQGLDLEILKALKELEVKKLNFSLVSADKNIREELKREGSVVDFTRTLLFSHSLGFKITSHIILGLPFCNLENMLEDILFLTQLPTLLGASIFYPVPKSSIFEKMKPEFKTRGYKKWRLSFGGIFKEKRDVLFCFYIVRIINFLKELADSYLDSHKIELSSFLYKFLKNHKIDFSQSCFSTDKKVPRSLLGVIIILKMIKERKIYRVVLQEKDSKITYSFIEDFPTLSQIQRFLDRFNNKRLITQRGKELRLDFFL